MWRRRDLTVCLNIPFISAFPPQIVIIFIISLFIPIEFLYLFGKQSICLFECCNTPIFFIQKLA